MKIIEVKEHGESVSKGMMATLKLCALIENDRSKELLEEIEKWCLYFDIQMDYLSYQLLIGVEDVPLHLVNSIEQAMSKTQHLRYDNLKKELNAIAFKSDFTRDQSAYNTLFKMQV